MTLVLQHPDSDGLTVLHYNSATGYVTARLIHPTENAPVVYGYQLAEFLRAVGIRFDPARLVHGETDLAHSLPSIG